MVGVAGIGPANARVKVLCLTTWLHPKKMVEEGGFEPPNPKELIYSQPRLAASLFLHMLSMVDVRGLEPLTPAV